MFIVVIAVIAVFRFRKRIAGGPVKKNRVIISLIFYFATSALAVFGSFQSGVSAWYLFVYGASLAGSAYISAKIVNNKITMWKSEDGTIHAKGGNTPYFVWIAGLVLRFALGYVFLGPDYLSLYATHSIPPSQVWIIIVVDTIMMIGVGSLAARSIHVLSSLKNLETKPQ